MSRSDVIGLTFGRLTVLEELQPRQNLCGKRKRMVRALCACGVERAYQLGNLKSGNTTACGCAQREARDRANAERAVPQVWTIEGDVAYILIGETKALIDAEDVPLASRFRWYVDNSGYIDTMQGDQPLHRLILGLPKGDPREADHKHHVTSDNRKSQIRIATPSQNKMNRCGNRVSSSKFKGVSFDPERNKFRAQIKANGRARMIGRYPTEIEAAIAYDHEAAKHFGEFAWLNFPPC